MSFGTTALCGCGLNEEIQEDKDITKVKLERRVRKIEVVWQKDYNLQTHRQECGAHPKS